MLNGKYMPIPEGFDFEAAKQAAATPQTMEHAYWRPSQGVSAPVAAPEQSSLWDKVGNWLQKADIAMYGAKPKTEQTTTGAKEGISKDGAQAKVEEQPKQVERFTWGLKRLPSTGGDSSAMLHPDMMRAMTSPWNKLA